MLKVFSVLLLIWLPQGSQGKHLLRFLTFCQRDVPGDGQCDIESDGDQLLYVDPVTYLTVPRLPEFEEQWIPDPGLAKSAYLSLGTCKYNIPRAIKGEKEPPEVIGGYVYQMICDCEYGDNITDMVYFVKNIFNQKLNNIYDSRLGKYIGFGEYGMKNAAHYNNQSWKMQARKVEVDTLCRYNARLFRKSILDRKVPPNVKVHQTKPADYGERSMLVCSVWGFYPQEVRVSWLRDGEEVTADVFSSDVLANGDWSFQFHTYLELTLMRGDRVTCRVDHSSLQESLEVEWDTFALDVKHTKIAVGIVFFFAGLAVAAVGALYYWWKKQRFHGNRL